MSRDRRIQRVMRFFCNWLIFDPKMLFWTTKNSELWKGDFFDDITNTTCLHMNTLRWPLTGRRHLCFVYLKHDYLLAICHIIQNHLLLFFLFGLKPESIFILVCIQNDIEICRVTYSNSVWTTRHDKIFSSLSPPSSSS